MKRAAFLVGIAATLGSAASCGGDVNATGGSASTGGGGDHSTSSTSASSMDVSSGSGVSSSSSSGSGGAGGATLVGSCSDDPPPGAKLAPPPKAYSGGACPMLVAGKNMMMSGKSQREFLLALPANIQPNEKLPIIFLWHWLNSSAGSFYSKGEVQAAVDTQRFIAVLPEAKGDLFFTWPYAVADSQPRMDEEFAFFDDMLSCVSAQFNVNSNCVSSAGVSAGALFTGQLAGGRGDYLSSIISLSGGVDGLIKPWAHPAHHMPALVLWGGSSDVCIVLNFEQASKALEAGLAKDGNFFLECLHNCGHGEPPFAAPPGLSKYAGLWQFVFDHPYWTSPGASPYKTTGLPMSMPTWCGIGAGSATQRVGPCGSPGC